ncbi:MAG: class I tRNA ligase family protein, partial [bacterium]
LKTTYRLRDWLVSRQRYWGAPIPIVYCEACGEQPVLEKDLPVLLPDDVDFLPTGESPLNRSKAFHNVVCHKCGSKARREADTMDTFVCSSWYYLRYVDPHNATAPFDKTLVNAWCPVDMYIGGAEHAVLHLLFSRFFVKALNDAGWVSFREPFTSLRNQGLILGEDGEKMSKSRGNVVNPDEIIVQYGADTLRMYEMFMGPLEDAKPWDTKGIIGIRRFLDKVWRLKEKVVPSAEMEENWLKSLHKVIKKVSNDIESLKFNTAISAMMIYVNELEGLTLILEDVFKKFLVILSPFAPHLSEELWQRLEEKESIFRSTWPTVDNRYLAEDKANIVIQVNGKVRDQLEVDFGSGEEAVIGQAQQSEKVKKYLTGSVKRTVYVPNKLLNIII